MSIKPANRFNFIIREFEIDVILDEYQTKNFNDSGSGLFEIDVILDEYQTIMFGEVEDEKFEIDVILDEYQTHPIVK